MCRRQSSTGSTPGKTLFHRGRTAKLPPGCYAQNSHTANNIPGGIAAGDIVEARSNESDQ
jgi:thioredoxin reductase